MSSADIQQDGRFSGILSDDDSSHDMADRQAQGKGQKGHNDNAKVNKSAVKEQMSDKINTDRLQSAQSDQNTPKQLTLSIGRQTSSSQNNNNYCPELDKDINIQKSSDEERSDYMLGEAGQMLLKSIEKDVSGDIKGVNASKGNSVSTNKGDRIIQDQPEKVRQKQQYAQLVGEGGCQVIRQTKQPISEQSKLQKVKCLIQGLNKIVRPTLITPIGHIKEHSIKRTVKKLWRVMWILDKALERRQKHGISQIVKAGVERAGTAGTIVFGSNMQLRVHSNNNYSDVQQQQAVTDVEIATSHKQTSHDLKSSTTEQTSNPDTNHLSIKCLARSSLSLKDMKLSVRHIPHEIFALSKRNDELLAMIDKLRDEIKENNIRQERENAKKRQSLEMLAEDLAEKNDLIAELNANLEAYQNKYEEKIENVLEGDYSSMGRELVHLNRINEKLSANIDAATNGSKQLNQKLKAAQERIKQLQTELNSKQQHLFDIQTQNRRFQEQEQVLEQKQAGILKKMGQIKRLLRMCHQKLKNPAKSFCTADVEKLESETYTLEMKFQMDRVMSYLYQIESNQMAQVDLGFLDSDQLDVLYDLRTRILDLVHRVQLLEGQQQVGHDEIVENDGQDRGGRSISRGSSSGSTSMKCSEIRGRLTKIGSDTAVMALGYGGSASIFGLLESSLDNKPGKGNMGASPSIQPVTNTSGEQQQQNGRILQLELDKRHQVEKISQLKSEFLHVRNVLFNFLKSLELK